MNILIIIEYLRDFNLVSIVLRLFLATFLSSIIGIERSKTGRAAGLRTHILVCLGATISAMTGLYIFEEINSVGDVSRIAAQVISGIGFLGAGTILVRNKSTIIGLTTAACVWATGAVGIALGYGFYEAAITGTALIFIVTKMLGSFDKRLHNDFKEILIYFEVYDYKYVNETLGKIESEKIIIDNISVKDSKINLDNSIGLEVSMHVKNEVNVEDMIKEFNNIENIAFAVACPI